MGKLRSSGLMKRTGKQWQSLKLQQTLGGEDAQPFCLNSQALMNRTQALVARKYHLVKL